MNYASTIKSVIAKGLLLSFSAVSMAQDVPTLGILYNTQEGHSLTYKCDRVSANQLNCEFTQTAVRVKLNASKVPSLLAQARQEFQTEQPLSSEECGMMKEVLDVIDGRKVTLEPERLAALTSVEKADAQRSARLYVEYCNKPNEANYLAIARFTHEKNQRTCLVSSNSYKQSFRPLREGGGTTVWVTQSSPEGSCGIVQLSRFEPEETKIGASKFTNWKYIARKAITNPSGELFPGAKCSGLDESSYTYDWRSKEHQITCDYIQFSPF